MKIKIREEFWGVGRVMYGYRKTDTGCIVVDAIVGDIEEFGRGKRKFAITEVGDKSVTVRYNARNKAYIRDFHLDENNPHAFYHCKSMDAGYNYYFELVIE